jgi:hypothetical protein
MALCVHKNDIVCFEARYSNLSTSTSISSFSSPSWPPRKDDLLLFIPIQTIWNLHIISSFPANYITLSPAKPYAPPRGEWGRGKGEHLLLGPQLELELHQWSWSWLVWAWWLRMQEL